MPIVVELEGRPGVELEFPDGTSDEVIQKAIRRDFKPSGETLHRIAASDPKRAHRTFGFDEYESMRRYESTMKSPSLWDAGATVVGEIGSGIGQLFTEGTLAEKGEALARGAFAGTGDLGAMVSDVLHFDTNDTYEEWLEANDLKASDENKDSYRKRLYEDYQNWREQMNWLAHYRTRLTDESPLPEVTQGSSY